MTVPNVSIVIPALNEENHLKTSLPILCRFLKTTGWNCEVLIVDDGSRDTTAQVVRFHALTFTELRLLQHANICGKGWAIRTGMLAARGELILFTDADLAYSLDDLKSIVQTLQQGADLAIGSRFLAGSQILNRPPWGRRWASRLYSLLVRGLFSLPTRDTQCGLKGFKREPAQRLFTRQRSRSFAFDVEILYWACRWGLSVQLVPVKLQNSISSSVQVSRHSLGVLADLIRIRWNAWMTSRGFLTSVIRNLKSF